MALYTFGSEEIEVPYIYLRCLNRCHSVCARKVYQLFGVGLIKKRVEKGV